MIGPMLLSQTKSFDAYHHFFSKIVSLNKDAGEILAFGTDGEEELFKAMKFSFPHASHLRCFNHFRDNCKEQLKSSNVPEQEQKQFISDIFGRRVGDTWEKGLLLMLNLCKRIMSCIPVAQFYISVINFAYTL